MQLLAPAPVDTLENHLANGGGGGLDRARKLEPGEIIDEIAAAGLRGRGGGGFPTHIKWRGAASEPADRRIVVCNAAEGEPGTFKDRAILRSNPYLVLEGLGIAARAVGATEAVIGIKAIFRREVGRLEDAAAEMQTAGMLTGIEVRLVEGPDDYLFGEETGLLEVIEGRDPLPRSVPPYVQGLAGGPGGGPVPTVVNNVETLAHVPGIVSRGADHFRRRGTPASPGTMVFTVSGDVRRETVAELPLGTPLSILLYGPAEGMEAGRRPKLVVSGVSNRPLLPSELDVPLSYEDLAAIGSGLGAGGFIVYDDRTCVAEVGAALSGFLQVGSCGQCPPCKLGTTRYAEGFLAIMEGSASGGLVEELTAWLSRVTDANRCGLGGGQRALASGLVGEFRNELLACRAGECPGHRGLVAPVLVDLDHAAGRFLRRDTL